MPQEALILAAPPLASIIPPRLENQPTRLEYRVLCKTIFPPPRTFQSVGLPPPRKKNPPTLLSLARRNEERDVIEKNSLPLFHFSFELIPSSLSFYRRSREDFDIRFSIEDRKKKRKRRKADERRGRYYSTYHDTGVLIKMCVKPRAKNALFRRGRGKIIAALI